ncbi:MAG: hypothetical protein HKP59_09890 [Lutibacter sp.]|uniref:hypothetical protein n=1 Tax=Lutibacter sp. TaxID=1925666 RepID=UPI0017FC824A|nr:hypothetical protein [Lutibacter sp.]MBT8317930.1 hypothetical protein [Lutibacter sp.]NNJ58788.1 hypothetical protein [Lutibacter sp.]
MEFFRIIDKQTTEEFIQEKINPKDLEKFTESMFFLEKSNNNFKGATLWGEFEISFDKINGGIRFTLLNCPNALSWTITTGFPPERTKIIIHCTINRTQKPTEFIEEIDEFLDEWVAGIERNF